ncbi:DUF4297 domain-containing protein [Paenibacillus endoradicis]|uniref:DUF4297 domain-containing protein n=1 Tax=Paenibacillus endoradicis TaxID=2972487 RepID=UPI002158D873|nr:DUF4297 domain-containing protein [Paenibacillus endoradicis]MCR8659318.1 DUF4297 domain-containing protein [Paenibacillus endoradicis]
MIERKLIDTIKLIPDDRSGDHAQDGFDYQFSTAIYLMLSHLKDKRDFAFMYEKIDDYVFVSDKLNSVDLYQSKSTSRTLTENELIKSDPVKIKKSKNKTKDNTDVAEPKTTGLSILEKIQNNIDTVTTHMGECVVKGHLLWNSDYEFGANLVKDSIITTKSDALVLDDLSIKVKDGLVTKTSKSDFSWENIKVNRLLSKKHHFDLTCKHIEKVIHSLIGENNSYSEAFYNSLFIKIKEIRISKKELTSEFLLHQIKTISSLESKKIEKENYRHLISDDDYRNNLLHIAVNELSSLKSLPEYPKKEAYNLICEYVDINYSIIKYPHKVFDEISALEKYSEICLINSEENIKAMIILAFLEKEV